MRRALAIAALIVAAGSRAAAEPDDLGPYERYMRGIAELEAGNAGKALPDLEAAAAVFTRNADVLVSLAKAKALSGDGGGALPTLARAVALGYGAGADSDPAFASLAPLPAFRALLPAIRENGRPVGTAKVAFTLAEKDLIPEGVAWDPSSRTLFVGRLARRKIVAVDSAGRARDFVPTGRDGLQQVLGMKVDAARRSLWVCSAEGDAPGGNATRASTLFRSDLATGRALEKIASPPGGRHLFNDVAIAKDGGLFLTDSEEGTVYRLRAASGKLEIFQKPGRLYYPNGIALSDDGRFLYVAHELGIVAWELPSGRTSPEILTTSSGTRSCGRSGPAVS